MKIFKDIPAVIASRIIVTVLIGFGCAVFGTAYYLYASDTILLGLSGCVFTVSLCRGIKLYNIVKEKRYETVEGVCVRVTPKLFGKFKTVKIMDDEGIETTVHLAKNCKLTIGGRYRLYFRESADNTGTVRSEYINAALATDMFLGCERADKS